MGWNFGHSSPPLLELRWTLTAISAQCTCSPGSASGHWHISERMAATRVWHTTHFTGKLQDTELLCVHHICYLFPWVSAPWSQLSKLKSIPGKEGKGNIFKTLYKGSQSLFSSYQLILAPWSIRTMSSYLAFNLNYRCSYHPHPGKYYSWS